MSASACSTMRGDPIVLVADDASVAGRVGHVRGEDRRGRVLIAVLGREQRDRLGPQERVVAGEHEDVVFGVEIVERARRERDAHRVAGAALHALLDELDRHLGHELLLERLDDAFGAVADDDHDPFEHTQLGRARRRRAAPSAGRTARATPSAYPSACARPSPAASTTAASGRYGS